MKKTNPKEAKKPAAPTVIKINILKSQYILPFAIFLCSVLLNAFVLINYSKSPFAQSPVWDAHLYWKWGQQIASGDLIGKTIFHQAPFYPYFLSLIILTFGKSLIAIYVIQATISAISSVLIYSITKKLSGNIVGACIAAFLFIFYDMQVFYATKVLSECLSIFLILLCIRLLLNNSPPKSQTFLAGLAFSFLCIAKPHFLIATPFILLHFFVSQKPQSLRPFLTQCAMLLLPILILIGAVTARNYIVGKDIVLISSNGGENFYIGNHDKADGSYTPVKGISRDIEYQNEDVNAVAEKESGRFLKRSEASTFWFHKGLKFIKDNPKKYLRIEWLKLKYIFSGAERSSMYYLYFEKKNITRGYSIAFINFYILLPLFLAGLLTTSGQWRRLFPIFIFLIVNVINIMIFFYDTRFMLLCIACWVIIAAVGISRFLEKIRSFELSKVGFQPYTLLLVLGTCLSILLFKADTKAWKPDSHMFMTIGEICLEQNHLDAALDAFTKASELNQKDWMPAFGVSKVCFRKGNTTLAAQLYTQAFENISQDFQTFVLRDEILDPIRQIAKTLPDSVLHAQN